MSVKPNGYVPSLAKDLATKDYVDGRSITVDLVTLTTYTAPAPAASVINTEVFSTSRVARTKIDLDYCTQGRMIVGVGATGNVATAAIKLSYSTTQAATWSGTDSGIATVLGTNGGAGNLINDSGWVSLPSGMKVANIYTAILVSVAFGTTAPTINFIRLYFK